MTHAREDHPTLSLSLTERTIASRPRLSALDAHGAAPAIADHAAVWERRAAVKAGIEDGLSPRNLNVADSFPKPNRDALWLFWKLDKVERRRTIETLFENA